MPAFDDVEAVAELNRPAFGRCGHFLVFATLMMSTLVVGCALYGELRTNLYGENFKVAQALCAGQGFANPMGAQTGLTAWTAPAYPAIFAFFLWLGDGSRDVVIGAVAILQVCVLIGTGFLVLALAWQTTRRISLWLAVALFLGGLSYHFWHWFQLAHDCWLVLLAFDLLIAGCCWFGPLANWQRTAGWGVFGGISAMVNPSITLSWLVLSLVLGFRIGSRSRPAVALLAAVLTLSPWTIRNYLVFGRLIPVKSNLAYELYQSQCLQKDGLYQVHTSRLHPSVKGSRERQEYEALGEMAYLDRKSQQFWESVRADPEDFLERVASRFLGAMVWYVPFNGAEEARRPWLLWARRFTHPLAFLALLVLLVTSFREPLHLAHWTVIGVYVLYLVPYIAASYYERYAVPLVAVKVLLVIWAADRIIAFWPRRQTESEARESLPVVLLDGDSNVITPGREMQG